MLDEELKVEMANFQKYRLLFISSVAEQGISKLKDALWNNINK